MASEWPIMEDYDGYLRMARSVASRLTRRRSLLFEELCVESLDSFNRSLIKGWTSRSAIYARARFDCLDFVARAYRERGESLLDDPDQPEGNEPDDDGREAKLRTLLRHADEAERRLIDRLASGASTFEQARAESGAPGWMSLSALAARIKKRMSGRHVASCPKVDWSKFDHLVGELSDAKLADLAGCTVASAHKRRKKLGLPAKGFWRGRPK